MKMSFAKEDLANLISTDKKTVKVSTKNAQYYKERLEAHVLDLATSDNPVIRLAVASSGNASSTCLKSMLEVETDEEIIGTILTHPNLSKTVKTAYAQKNKELVQSIIDRADTDDSFSVDEVSEAVNNQ